VTWWLCPQPRPMKAWLSPW